MFWGLLKNPGNRYDHKMSTWPTKAERAQFFAPCHCFTQRILGTRPVCQALLDPVEGSLPAQTPTPRDHRYRPCGKRALTTDHPPTQLSDVLLSGFFPLKLTPEVGQHAWGHPGTPPSHWRALAHSRAGGTYRDPGFPCDARHALYTLQAHGPRRAWDALHAAGAVGTLDAFRAQLPSTARLQGDSRMRVDGRPAMSCSCHPMRLPHGWQRRERLGSAGWPGGPAMAPDTSGLLQRWSLDLCLPLTSPLGPTGPLGPCKREVHFHDTCC